MEHFNAKNHIGETLSRALRLTDTPCGGEGSCGKCCVLARGALTEPTAAELRILGTDAVESGSRLACQTRILGDFEYQTLSVTRGILFGETASFSVPVDDPLSSPFGIALDIGTTTVELAAVNTVTGNVSKSVSFLNPQREYGSDVISRIGRITGEPDLLRVMEQQITEAVNSAITQMASCIPPVMVVAANTVMEHIAAGISPVSMGTCPYKPASLFGGKVKNRFISADETYFMPCVSGFIGGDVVAGLIAAGAFHGDEYELYCDLGTNGEIAVGNRKRIYACSVAAGPTFEGMGIECGTVAALGAVRRVYGEDRYETVGGGEACGICGAGLVGAVAYLLEAGIIDKSGRMADKFYIDRDKKIYVSPLDVRAYQLAKAAVRCGIDTLLERTDITPANISRFIIAGGLGYHLEPKQAAKTGLFPRELLSVLEAAGNASLRGAAMFLSSSDARKQAEEYAEKIEYIELADDSEFSERFCERLGF